MRDGDRGLRFKLKFQVREDSVGAALCVNSLSAPLLTVVAFVVGAEAENATPAPLLLKETRLSAILLFDSWVMLTHACSQEGVIMHV